MPHSLILSIVMWVITTAYVLAADHHDAERLMLYHTIAWLLTAVIGLTGELKQKSKSK